MTMAEFIQGAASPRPAPVSSAPVPLPTRYTTLTLPTKRGRGRPPKSKTGTGKGEVIPKMGDIPEEVLTQAFSREEGYTASSSESEADTVTLEEGLRSVVQQIDQCLSAPGQNTLGQPLKGLGQMQQQSAHTEQLSDIPQEHFIREAMEAVGDRAARELTASQIALELAIRTGDITLGAIGRVLRSVIQDPSLFSIPEEGVTMKYLGEMSKAVNTMASSMATAVELSRKVGGEPDQTILHGLLYLASNMTPQERIEYRISHEVPARLLTGASDAGGSHGSAFSAPQVDDDDEDNDNDNDDSGATEVGTAEPLRRPSPPIIEAQFSQGGSVGQNLSALPPTALQGLDEEVPKSNVLDRFKSVGGQG